VFQSAYNEAVAAMAWPDTIRPEVDEWKALQDDRLTIVRQLGEVTSNRQLRRLYARDETAIRNLQTATDRLRQRLGLPPAED
jgi:hypothetical protein